MFKNEGWSLNIHKSGHYLISIIVLQNQLIISLFPFIFFPGHYTLSLFPLFSSFTCHYVFFFISADTNAAARSLPKSSLYFLPIVAMGSAHLHVQWRSIVALYSPLHVVLRAPPNMNLSRHWQGERDRVNI